MLFKLIVFFFCYPRKIIPKKKYTLEIAFTPIFNSQTPIAFVRRSSKSLSETFDDMGILREDAISPRELPNLSINILGSKFRLKYLKYRVVKSAMTYWRGEKIKIMSYLKCIEEEKINTAIFLLLKDVYLAKFPYKKDSTSIKESKIIDILGHNPLKDGDLYILKGSLQIKHSPNKLNYWHAELNLYDVENNPILKTSSAWQKSAAQFALTNVIVMAARPYISSLYFSSLSKEYYLKQLAV